MKRKHLKFIAVSMMCFLLLFIFKFDTFSVLAAPSLGTVVDTPTEGFTRYDDTADSSKFVYHNMSIWTSGYGDNYNFVNANDHGPTDTTQKASVSFDFQGTQFYLICQCYEGGNGRNKNIDIYIDGVKKTFSAPQQRIDGHVVYYVSNELTDGLHSVVLIYNPGISGNFVFDGVDVKGVITDPSTTPTPGASISSPLSGFTRYDDTADSSKFEYENMYQWTSNYGDTYNFINANNHSTPYTTQESAVGFYFYGTQFYFLCQCYDEDNGRNKAIDIYIDGEKTTFSAPQIRIDGHTIYYVSPVLKNKVHRVVLVDKPNVSGDLVFDGVDIKGTLINNYDATVTTDVPTTMKVGVPSTFHVTATNYGAQTWTEADQFRLGSVGDVGIMGEPARLYLPTGVTVSYGQSYTWTLTATPTSSGAYTFNWRMLKEGDTWFGGNVATTVTVPSSSRTFDTSILLSSGSTTSSTIGSSTDSAFYKINKTTSDAFLEAKIVYPVVNGKSIHYTVTLYDSSKHLITSAKSTNDSDFVRCKVNSDGTYYIVVSGDANNYSAQSSFTLTVR